MSEEPTEPRRAMIRSHDIRDRLVVVAEFLATFIFGGVLLVLAFWEPYGWTISSALLVIAVAIYLFWPQIRTRIRHRPRRAVE